MKKSCNKQKQLTEGLILQENQILKESLERALRKG
jgi:hypothetical protein